MFKFIGITVTATTLVLATQAQAFSSANGYRVNQVDNAVFEVIPRGRSNTNFYWCSASDYARRVLGAGWQDRIYIARGYGPSVTTGRKTAVQFTLNPQAAGVTPLESGGFRSGLQAGDSMSVQQANAYCDPFPARF
ncbi:hypothetical protein FGK63_11410 [Ruegeria sediminis]|uniref:Uncharacterized protein n=1 Tax=Ruegeria sediminis TaxID=2583820 RepID=A0ABY2WZM5_9RHOB|nr:hypothetical protein [Ruegeria sediminis]TMV08046.1 hypothetical protein FGK63_11410 [Ruegeria sediminis]